MPPADDHGKAVLISGDPANASFGAMVRDLAAAFGRIGQETDVILLRPGFDQTGFLRRVETWPSRPPRLVLSWNCHVNIAPGGQSIHDRFGIPLVSWCVDHPCQLIDGLRKTPANAVIGHVDRRHATFLDEQAGNVTRKLFLPHAGPPPDPAAPSMAERDIPILFCGNVPPLPDLAGVVRQVLDIDAPKAAALADTMRERLLERVDDVYVIVRDTLSASGLAPAPAVLGPLCGTLIEYLERHERRRVLRALSGLPVTVAGVIDPALELDGFTRLGQVTFRQFLSLARRTRLLLNISPSFNQGGHERVFYGTAAGAVILALHSRFLAETFAGGESMAFIGQAEGMAGQVRGLLAAPRLLNDIARAAAAVQQQYHTFDSRAQAILAAIGQQ